MSGGNLNGTADDEYKWLKGLKERYEELITTFITSQETDYENGAKKEDNSMPAPSGMVGDTRVELVTSAMYSNEKLDSYLNSLLLRGLSQTYIEKVSQYLSRFVNTCEQLNQESALNYLAQSAHLKPNSRSRYATYLKGLLNHLDIPFDVKVKVPKTLPDYIEGSDIDQIVEWIKSKQSHKKSIDRDLTLLETARKTGMRRSELGNLKVENVNLDKNRIYVRGGKGDKDRVIPIHPDLLEGLSELVRGKANKESVFGLKPHSLGNKFRDWANSAGVDLHTHSFRHYFATSLVEKGANIKAIQELLGHSSLATTQVYLSVTADHLEEAINILD